MMIIPLVVENKYYAKDTLVLWKITWERICGMAYENRDICREIITLPGVMFVDGQVITRSNEEEHAIYYEKRIPDNHDQIVFDATWRVFSKKYGAPYDLFVIPQLERLHVPRELFDSLGVVQFFKHCFPNCRITFWGE